LSDAIGKRGIYVVDDPDDLQCREEWDRGQKTSFVAQVVTVEAANRSSVTREEAWRIW
jgi:hypothetical protein